MVEVDASDPTAVDLMASANQGRQALARGAIHDQERRAFCGPRHVVKSSEPAALAHPANVVRVDERVSALTMLIDAKRPSHRDLPDVREGFVRGDF